MLFTAPPPMGASGLNVFFTLWIVALALLPVGGASAQAAPGVQGGLALERSRLECLSAERDMDADGLDDRCELALARSFAPLLVVREGGCSWDESVAPARLGGGYLFAAQPHRPDAVRIAYLPAYFRDCGWSGPKCLLPWVGCDPHAGDSEILIVDVVAVGERQWRTEAVFLSAHCFGRSGGDCRWYGAGELETFDWVDEQVAGAPVVWVAEGRNANYPSRSACDRGHHRIDTCDHHQLRYRFPIVSERQNIGSRSNPVEGTGCVGASRLDRRIAPAQPEAVECFWSEDAPFRGWTGVGAGATPYARYLREIAGF